MDDPHSLVWSPLLATLQNLADSSQLRMLISPFATRPAVEEILEMAGQVPGIQVITRWSPADIATGVADLSLYPFLKDRGVPLYIHPAIHLKLYVFDSNRALHASGNATNRGLGISAESNIEVGAVVELAGRDWRRIIRLLEESVAVDDVIYEAAEAYKAKHGQPRAVLPVLDLKPHDEKGFSILALPQSPSPETFRNWYFERSAIDPEMVATFYHDLASYNIPDDLAESEFDAKLRSEFTKAGLVEAIVVLIREHQSARFGLVKEWLQRNCSDKPTPFRNDLTELTRNLYSWLAFFYREISWDRPHHSMILRWYDEP